MDDVSLHFLPWPAYRRKESASLLSHTVTLGYFLKASFLLLDYFQDRLIIMIMIRRRTASPKSLLRQLFTRHAKLLYMDIYVI